MNKSLLLALIWLTTSSNGLPAILEAQVRLYCVSLRVATATADVLGQRNTLELGTAEGPDGFNGELAPTFNLLSPTHSALFRLTDPSFPEGMIGNFAVDIPEGLDENANGFPDFFETSQAFPTASSSGKYASPVDDGDVSASWSRSESASIGTCRFKLTSKMFGELPEFTTQFEVIEYTGTLRYAAGPTNVETTVHLAQTGTLTNTFDGPLQFTRSARNRFNELNLSPGAWTNSSGQSLTFTNSVILRDTTLRTNYFGFVDFEDGELRTGDADYLTWQMSIDDVNDADKDGIPDFSDDPADSGSERPALRIFRSDDRVQLEITGQTGKKYTVEESASLNPLNWSVISSGTLTGPTAIVDLPVTGKALAFWRVKVE